METTTAVVGGSGSMSVLGLEGDMEIKWDVGNMDQVATAQETFNKFRSKGYAAFRVGRSGQRGEQITEFNATHERILLVPPMQGG